MIRPYSLVMVLGAVLMIFMSVFAGCGGGSEANDSALLHGKQWVVTEIAGLASVLPLEQGRATAAFADEAMSGSGTVNRYSASYETSSGNSIRIFEASSTQMAGPPEAMAQETAYFGALENVASYVVTAESLEFRDDKGRTLVLYEAAEPVPLVGTEWEATAYNNGKGALQSLDADSRITALFADDGSLSGNASVNQYMTEYTVSGENTMAIGAAIGTTKMAGPENLMAQEAAYLDALPQTATYAIDGSELWLRDADGAALAHYVAK